MKNILKKVHIETDSKDRANDFVLPVHPFQGVELEHINLLKHLFPVCSPGANPSWIPTWSNYHLCPTTQENTMELEYSLIKTHHLADFGNSPEMI